MVRVTFSTCRIDPRNCWEMRLTNSETFTRFSVTVNESSIADSSTRIDHSNIYLDTIHLDTDRSFQGRFLVRHRDTLPVGWPFTTE